MLKVNAEVVNAHALQQTGNVIQMFVGIVGSGECVILCFLYHSFTGLCVG